MNVVHNGSIGRKLAALVAVIALPLSILSAGCNPECVDKYDCKSKNTKTTEYTCVSNKCVVGSAGGDAPDAGP